MIPDNLINEIIDRLKLITKAKSDSSLASNLGIKQQTVSAWRKRGSIDFLLIYEVYPDIDWNYLITGEQQQVIVSKNNNTLLNDEILKLKAQVSILQDTIVKLQEKQGASFVRKPVIAQEDSSIRAG